MTYAQSRILIAAIANDGVVPTALDGRAIGAAHRHGWLKRDARYRESHWIITESGREALAAHRSDEKQS